MDREPDDATSGRRKTIGLLLAAVLGFSVLAAAAPAAADHRPCASLKREIEASPTGDALVTRSADRTGITADGFVDAGGILMLAEEIPDCAEDEVLYSYVDDAFASAVAVDACFTDNVVSAHSLETHAAYEVWELDDCKPGGLGCGFGSTALPSWDFEAMVLFVGGPVKQAANCDPTYAPTGTSGGILNPNGGMYVSFD